MFTTIAQCVAIALLACFQNTVHAALTVLDDAGKAVDWAIVYKFPKDPAGKNKVYNGDEFVYLLPNQKDWQRGSVPLSDPTGHAIGNTLHQLYSKSAAEKEKMFYIFYNDDSPVEGIKRKSGSTVGHSKGYAVFDKKTGFWCIHSTPRFGVSKGYETETNLNTNAQTYFCLSVRATELPKLAEHFIMNKVWAYDCNVPNEFKLPELAEYCAKFQEDSSSSPGPRSGSRGKKSEAEDHLFMQTATRAGVKIDCFSKNDKFEQDIWRDMIAPHYKSGFAVQSWLAKSTGPSFDSSGCSEDTPILNLQAFSLGQFGTVHNNKDHSKFGFTLGQNASGVVCVGDVNRQCGQLSRGGGFCCIRDSLVHAAFSSSQNEMDECQVTGGRGHKADQEPEFKEWCATQREAKD